MHLPIIFHLGTLLFYCGLVQADAPGWLPIPPPDIGPITSIFAQITSCVNDAAVVTKLADYPLPQGELKAFMGTHSDQHFVDQYCSVATQVPPSLTSTYSAYTTSLANWYASASCELDHLIKDCGADPALKLPELPFCTATMNQTTCAKLNAASANAVLDLSMMVNSLVVAGIMGAVAML